MANTPNYNLYKPNRVDNLPVDTTLSDNFTIIDTEIKNRKDDLDTHKASTTAHDSANITHQSSSVKQAIIDVNTRVDNVETDLITTEELLNDRIDNIIASSGTSSTEVVDARGSFTVLKNRLDNIQINIKAFGAKGDGVTDDTSALIAAITFANSLNTVAAYPVSISFTDGSYVINKPSDLNIPSLVGVGNVKLIVNDNKSFVISSNFTMTNIQVVSTLEYLNSDSSYKPLFKATSTVSNISFTNVVFDTQLSISDGSRRASAVMDFKIVNGLYLSGVIVKGYRRGITSMGTSTNIKGDMLHFENVELAVYVQGSDPNLTNTNYARNIQFTNVSHINTQTQAINFFKLAGADTFLFEKCDTITISNVTTEYAVERAIYSSSSNNLVASNFQIKNSEGIKFVGYVRNDTGLNNIADTCRLSNISVVTNTADSWLCSFYFAKNITVKNCSINGNFQASSAIQTVHYIENLVMENNYAENLKRGFFEFTYYGDIPASGTVPVNPAGNYPSGINGMKMIQNNIKGSHSIAYPVIKIGDLSGSTLSPGTYRHFNIVVKNNNIDNSLDDYTNVVAGQFCQGLININDVKNLRMSSNVVNGYLLNDVNNNQITTPYQVGSNSSNVQIQHKEILRNRDNKYYWGTLFVSAGTEFEMITTRFDNSFEDRAVISVKLDGANPLTTKDFSQNFTIKGSMYIHNITDIAIPLIGYGVAGYTLPTLFGLVEVVSSADAGTGRFVLKSDGTSNLLSGSSTLYATSVTSGKFAIFKDGSVSRYTLRYLAGSAMGFIINYNISTV